MGSKNTELLVPHKNETMKIRVNSISLTSSSYSKSIYNSSFELNTSRVPEGHHFNFFEYLYPWNMDFTEHIDIITGLALKRFVVGF